MGLLTLNELAGLGNNGLIALAPPPPASQPGQAPMGPARQDIMPGQRLPVRSMLTASAAQPYAPVSRARTVRSSNPDVEILARAKAAHGAAVRAAALAHRRAQAARTRERAKPVLTAADKERLRFAAWQREVARKRAAEKAAVAAKETARRKQIAALEWTAPVSSLPLDLRPVAGESFTEGLKRDWLAFRRGLTAGETYEDKARRTSDERRYRQGTRDTLVRWAATPGEYRVYKQVPEALKQVAFVSKASPYIARDVKEGRSPASVALREAYRRYVR